MMVQHDSVLVFLVHTCSEMVVIGESASGDSNDIVIAFCSSWQGYYGILLDSVLTTSDLLKSLNPTFDVPESVLSSSYFSR